MSPRRAGGRGEQSPRKDDRRERDYDRRGGRDRERERDRSRSRSPDDRDREMKDDEHNDDHDQEREPEPEAVANGDDHKGLYKAMRCFAVKTDHLAEAPEDPPNPPQHDDLDTAQE